MQSTSNIINLAFILKKFKIKRERRWSVYYELYIDVLFMVNFMMDFILLLIVKQITKCPTTQLRIFASSFIGALLTCMVYLFLSNNIFVKFVLFHVIINVIIVKVGFRCKSLRMFMQSLITLYIAGFMLGGVAQYLRQYLKVGSLFFLVASLSYIVVRGIWWFLEHLQMQKKIWYEVELFVGDEVVKLNALLDTGNGLLEPMSGEPVSILELVERNKLVSDCLEVATMEIPYYSIGGEGVMKAFYATKMHIIGECDCWVDRPIIAISNNPVSNKRAYNMILHPKLF